MGYGIVKTEELSDIADAIRQKLGVQTQYKPGQMADAIESISGGGGITPTGTKSITENGTYDIASFANVAVNVPTDGGETDYDVATLPAEYQRVEYIQSSGTQYIQLPIGFTPADEIHMMGAINNTTNSEKALVCPASYNTDNNRFAICASNGSKFMCAYGNVSTSNSAMGTNRDTLIHDWSYRNGFFISESAKSAYGVGNASFGTENPNVRLFYGFNAASAGKIRYYVHKKAGDTGVALYACYRKADGVIGLYDVDNDVFYTNAGTGTFTKGADL